MTRLDSSSNHQLYDLRSTLLGTQLVHGIGVGTPSHQSLVYCIRKILFLVGSSSDTEVVSSKRSKIATDDLDCDDGSSAATTDLYKRLLEVDPERASEIHPNERRKIVRSLEGKQV